MANKTNFLALIAGALILVAPGIALAGGNGGNNCGCQPPPQQHHQPPQNNQNVYVTVNAAASASATVNANVNAMVNIGAQVQGTTGGGGYASTTIPGTVSVVGVAVGGQEESDYEAVRTRIEKVVIQAFCFDDKDVPHPASQVTPDREITEDYDGEVYRCIAGAHMQVTIAPWAEQISFEGGRTLACQKGEALYHSPGKGAGVLECRAQKPARDCNERSLLRRFGAGIKVMVLVETEKYTAHREEHQGAVTALSLDGGVGGLVN